MISGEILEPRERLEFEHLLQLLRLSFLLTPVLIVLAFGAMPFELRHITDSIFYTLLFLITSSVVAFLMNKSADVVVRREQAWRVQIGERNAELERTAGQLAESIRLRDAMLTGVTHDLRAPVTVVKVQAQVLRRRAAPSLWPGIERIEAAATRMAQWIDELLESATLRGPEELQLSLESVDLVNLAR